jgi:hypothetical protein
LVGPAQPLAVGAITYVTVPVAVVFGLTNVFVIAPLPDVVLPVIPPVAELVHVYVVPPIDEVGVKFKAVAEQFCTLSSEVVFVI